MGPKEIPGRRSAGRQKWRLKDKLRVRARLGRGVWPHYGGAEGGWWEAWSGGGEKRESGLDRSDGEEIILNG